LDYCGSDLVPQCCHLGYNSSLELLRPASTDCTSGFNTSFGVYLSHFEANETFPGSTPLMYSLVGSLSVAVALLCAPLANVLTKRFGHRMPMLAGKHTIESTLFLSTSLTILGMLACSLGQCMAGLCTTFNTFIVCQGFVFGVGTQ
jgi:MFS family permease